jgi:hypothetical protein
MKNGTRLSREIVGLFGPAVHASFEHGRSELKKMYSEECKTGNPGDGLDIQHCEIIRCCLIGVG